MTKIVVIADDLSGAAELAGIAFAHGLAAEVQRAYEPKTAVQVIAIDASSRDLPVEEAAARAGEVAQQVIANRPAWIFKKVDSLLRGHVRLELEAMVEAIGQPRALLVPCNPSRGRCIVGGQYRINGAPLHETELAADPAHPRRTSEVQTLLGGGKLRLHSIGRWSPLPAEGISIPDAESWTDLVSRAEEVAADSLVAGAADFFRAVLELRVGRAASRDQPAKVHFDAPLLAICGSKVAWPDRREECRRAGIPAIAPEQPPADLRRHPVVFCGVGDDLTSTRAEVGERLTPLALALIEQLRPKTVLAEGGATAAAIASRLGWSQFEVAALVPEGVGVLQPHPAQSPLFCLKPGSYPWPEAVWHEIRRLADHQSRY